MHKSFGEISIINQQMVQTWVNYTEKISIKLQLLKQFVNYDYNYTKLNPT